MMKNKNKFLVKFTVVAAMIGLFSPSVDLQTEVQSNSSSFSILPSQLSLSLFQTAEARRGGGGARRGGGGARSRPSRSTNRSSNRSRNKNVNRNSNRNVNRNVNKTIKLLTHVFVAVVLLNPLLAWSEHPTADEAREWLSKMSSAIKNLDYEGTFVYVHGSTLEALSIVHSRTAVGESERLFSLVGAAREILREDDLLTCILPDDEAVVVEKTRPRKYLPAGIFLRRKLLMKSFSEPGNPETDLCLS